MKVYADPVTIQDDIKYRWVYQAFHDLLPEKYEVPTVSWF